MTLQLLVNHLKRVFPVRLLSSDKELPLKLVSLYYRNKDKLVDIKDKNIIGKSLILKIDGDNWSFDINIQSQKCEEPYNRKTTYLLVTYWLECLAQVPEEAITKEFVDEVNLLREIISPERIIIQ